MPGQRIAELTYCQVITPYLVNPNQANLQSKVFFVWGSTCVLCFIYAYLFVWETKGLTLEQVDRMMEEAGSPRHSAAWKAHSTFAHDMGLDNEGKMRVTHSHHDTSNQEGVGKAHVAAGGPLNAV